MLQTHCRILSRLQRFYEFKIKKKRQLPTSYKRLRWKNFSSNLLQMQRFHEFKQNNSFPLPIKDRAGKITVMSSHTYSVNYLKNLHKMRNLECNLSDLKEHLFIKTTLNVRGKLTIGKIVVKLMIKPFYVLKQI